MAIARFDKRLIWGLLFSLSLMLCLWLGTVARAQPAEQTPTPAELVQQGINRYQVGELEVAIDRWQAALAQYQASRDVANSAIVLENLARAYQRLGQTSEEIQYWQQAIEQYRQLGDRVQQGRMLSEQAQAYLRLGQTRQAIALLCGSLTESCTAESALQLAQTTSDQIGEAAALGSLGEAYRLRGNSDQAIALLSASAQIASAIEQTDYLAAALNGLGNTHLRLAQINDQRAASVAETGNSQAATTFTQAGREQDRAAIDYFEQSLKLAQGASAQIRAFVDVIPAYSRTENAAAAQAALQQALTLFETLPDSQEKVFTAIDLARLLQSPDQTARFQCLHSTAQGQATSLLEQAIAIANEIGDQRSKSFALGELGHVYECQQNDERAIDLTQQARWAAEQDLRAKDSLYLWEWQTGRILKAQGRSIEAIDAYEKSVATLEPIRSDLLIANRDLQFDFRDTVDPIYRGLIELRLENAATDNRSINIALKHLDALRLAELQNYFGDDCVILAATPTPIDAIQTNEATAVFSSVILADRTAIIVTLPNQQQQIAWINVDQNTLRAEINSYRRSLERFYAGFSFDQAEKVYDWIIAPFAEALRAAQVETLVFVQDGVLRSVPMAALYDGNQFLIEQYAIATTPSLALTEAKPLDRDNLRALALGLTQAADIDGQTFPAIGNVDREIAAIETELPGSRPLLNQEFTRDRLQEELRRTTFPIVHMATHGQFGTEPDSTFLVTGDRQKLTITDLDSILRQIPIDRTVELLSLTACQTAAGDDRSALGLAGVAVQAGVRSALASLWFIDDVATAQIATQFYANLRNPALSKAEALQAAQIALIQSGGQNARPAYWAAFVLIGNWL
ncbi:MAG: CHAT domain-containing protein [Microcoleus sp. SIO2G3]|nr:CHAT domain-containing protein [Microcoleus sp. SIO2G3]